MTREEAITYIKVIWNRYIAEYEIEAETKEAVDMAISALSTDTVHKPDYSYEADMARRLKDALSAEPSDLISSADAIEAVQDVDTRESVNVSEAVKAINALPSADRPSGEWIPKQMHQG